MSRVRWIERALLAVALIVAVVSWRASSRTELRARSLEDRLTALADAQEQIALAAARTRVPSPTLFRGQGGAPVDAGVRGPVDVPPPEPAAAPRIQPADNPLPQAMNQRSFRARADATSGGPAAQFLDTLYEAADRLAVEEQWDARTYDGVSQVFDTTMLEMNDLFLRTRNGEVPLREARRGAMAIRGQAMEDLRGLIGDDGVASLRATFVDEAQALRGR